MGNVHLTAILEELQRRLEQIYGDRLQRVVISCLSVSEQRYLNPDIPLLWNVHREGIAV
jgi:hypothetical protein